MMICSINQVVIICADKGYKYISSTDRQGLEYKILKEGESSDIFRKYYCNNCKKEYNGKTDEDWQIVMQHLGTRPAPPTKQWYEIDEFEIIDYYDTKLLPSVREKIRPVMQVFND